jgi:hypothetical protein
LPAPRPDGATLLRPVATPIHPNNQEDVSMANQSRALIADELRINRFESLVGRAQPPPVSAATPTRGKPISRDELPGLGRSIVVAGGAAVLIVLGAVTIGLLTMGASWTSSLGIGAFAALWGGGGFGAMIGGVLYAHRADGGTPAPSLVGSEHDLSPALLPAWPSSTPVAAQRR